MTDDGPGPKAEVDDLVRLVCDTAGYLLGRIPAGTVGGVVEAYDLPIEGYAVDVTIRNPDGTLDHDNVILHPADFEVMRHPSALNIDADVELAALLAVLSDAAGGVVKGARLTTEAAVIEIEGPWPRDAFFEKEIGSRMYRYDGWAEARPGVDQNAMVTTVTAILEALWSRGIPANALTEYRERLPDHGGRETWEKLRPGEREGAPGEPSPDGSGGAG